MHANNEIGTHQRIAVISQLTAHRGILLHTDAAQSAGYGLFDADEPGVGRASPSAHKPYGPKGIGALYLRGGTQLSAQQTGGGQERGLRASTLNVPGIVGFGAADLLDHLPDIAAATGSACNTGAVDPSHILTAIGLTPPQARRTPRLGIGRTTTVAEVDRAAASIAQAAATHRTVRTSAA